MHMSKSWPASAVLSGGEPLEVMMSEEVVRVESPQRHECPYRKRRRLELSIGPHGRE